MNRSSRQQPGVHGTDVKYIGQCQYWYGNGVLKKLIILIVGILAAFFITNTMTTVALSLSGLKGAAGMVVGFIVYAVIFFAVIQLLQN